MRPPPISRPNDSTIDYYESSAEQYFRSTVGLRLDALWDRFLARVTPGGLILDAGSGSGRDTREFLARGFAVDSFDASPALATLSYRLTGQPTKVATFETWCGGAARYDGVWAFASLLHVARPNLPAVVGKISRAMKPGTFLLTSFKHGVADLVDTRGRRFTNFTPSNAAKFFECLPYFDRVEVWHENASAAHGEDTTWVYVMVRRESFGRPPAQLGR